MRWFRLLLPLCVAALLTAPAHSAVTLDRLRCEYLADPVGIDIVKPRLSWQLGSADRGCRQTAYQVLVASSPELLAQNRGDRWDSGKVASDQSTQLAYAGAPLQSRQRCYWKVRVWDQTGQPSAWSAAARWSMGLLKREDWQAQWIGGTAAKAEAPLELGQAEWVWFPEASFGPGLEAASGRRFFRRKFTYQATAAQARLVVTADDQFTCWLNGQMVGRSDGNGDAWRRPQQFDVTRQIVAGDNVLAIDVSNNAGAAGLTPAGVAARLVLKPVDGLVTEIRTDAQWRAADRSGTDAWRSAAFDDAAWQPVKVFGRVGIQPWGEQFEYATTAGAHVSPLLRRAFGVAKPLRSAQISVCGLGYHELYLDGAKVGDHVLDPALTQYDKRALYVSYDLTSALRPGRHALGVQLANGIYDQWVSDAWSFQRSPWLAPPELLLRLDLDYTDGTHEQVVSDGSWKQATGPLTFDLTRVGVCYDARLEQPGWATATFDDQAWHTAALTPGPKGKLAAQRAEPIKVIDTLPTRKLTEPKPGVYVFDVGQNLTGWAKVTASGPAGTTITLKYGERLNGDGTLNQGDIATLVHYPSFQTDVYTLKGAGVETFETRFAFHGFQYVQVTGLTAKPAPEMIAARVVHTAFEPAGTFECSNELFNRIERNAIWSYVSNFVGYPSDCPHREKNGWTGDAQLAAEMGLLHFRGEAAYTRWLDDMRDAQRPDGKLPCIVPTGGWGYNTLDGPAWESAYPLIAWWLYEYRGDRRILEDHYEGFERFVDFYANVAKDGICRYGLGDWCPAKTGTPSELTSTGYLYEDALVVARAATLLGHPEDAAKYNQLAERVKAAFNKTFYKADGATYANGGQTSLSCALYQDLVEPANKPAVLKSLVDNVAKANGHLDVGILGSKYLLRVLSDGGRADVAYQIATQKTFPSWGRWMDQGATTLWEQWDGGSSRNHIMFGDISAWFIEYLAGIRPDPAAPGFQHFWIRPTVVGDLTAAKATHASPYGTIVSDWKVVNGTFNLSVTVPANSDATVWLPTKDAAAVRDGGKPLSGGVKVLRTEAGGVVLAVPAGRYALTAPLAR